MRSYFITSKSDSLLGDTKSTKNPQHILSTVFFVSFVPFVDKSLFLGCWSSFLFSHEMKRGNSALVGFAVNDHRPAMQIHDGLDDGETQPGSFRRASRIDAIKPVEQLGQVFRRDTAACVLHADRRAAAL